MLVSRNGYSLEFLMVVIIRYGYSGTLFLIIPQVYIPGRLFLYRYYRDVVLMITQEIVKKLWDEAGYGNLAIWENDTITVVPVDYSGETAGKKPLAILKPIALVNRFELLDYALNDEELLTKIEETIRAAGGQVTRGPRS